MKRGTHPNSLANLKPQKPGEEGHNKNGRPKKPITKAMLKMLDQVASVQIAGKPNDKRWAELIAASILMNAYKGNGTALRELLDRVEGKVAQPITGNDGGPIEVDFTKARERLIGRLDRLAASGDEAGTSQGPDQ